VPWTKEARRRPTVQVDTVSRGRPALKLGKRERSINQGGLIASGERIWAGIVGPHARIDRGWRWDGGPLGTANLAGVVHPRPYRGGNERRLLCWDQKKVRAKGEPINPAPAEPALLTCVRRVQEEKGTMEEYDCGAAGSDS